MDGSSSGQPNGRVLVVNADDFGHTKGVNAGVIKAHEQGIVTSASLMVRWPAAAEAAAYARSNPSLGIGLHVDLGEWVPRNGGWELAWEVVPLADFEDFEIVNAAVREQLDLFRELIGADPTHVDSHQHIHVKVEPPIGVVFGRLARELGVPLRHRAPGVRYCGDLYGQTQGGQPVNEAISVENLVHILEDLEPGVTELACHPGEGDDLDSLYRAERERELEVLCDPRVREVIERERISLRSFAELARADARPV
jgi:predicted glycoside hydrolase/deacetylase ChbG (UPF0249 family)